MEMEGTPRRVAPSSRLFFEGSGAMKPRGQRFQLAGSLHFSTCLKNEMKIGGPLSKPLMPKFGGLF